MARADSWIRDLVASLDAHVDEDTRALVLAECGRRCISPQTVARAARLWQASPNVQAWLDALNAAHLGGGSLTLVGETIEGRYERCLCSIGKQGGLSPTFCLCSRAWLQELFAGATGRPATVTMTQTVLGGAPDCRFEVRLEPPDTAGG